MQTTLWEDSSLTGASANCRLGSLGQGGEGGEECHQGTEADQGERPWVSELRQNVGNEKRSSKIWKMVGKMESSLSALFQAGPWHTRCPNQYPQPSYEQVMFFS